jgi:hypothetical protein
MHSLGILRRMFTVHTTRRAVCQEISGLSVTDRLRNIADFGLVNRKPPILFASRTADLSACLPLQAVGRGGGLMLGVISPIEHPSHCPTTID